MATLRSGPLQVFTDDGTAERFQDQNIAAGMGSLRRGFQSGLIGNDIMDRAAEEATLRAQQKVAEADALRKQIDYLHQRQGIYAPEVGRIEDIDGIGSALSYGAGQVGQGTASMIPSVAGAGMTTAAGTLLGLVPHPLARIAGAGLRNIGAPLAAYGINAGQLKGEAYEGMRQDPTIMANHSPEELNRMATMTGMGNAVLDTAVPAMIGRQLGGAGLRQGLSRIGTGPKILGELAMEGGTEAAQGYANAQVQNYLNPAVEHNDPMERVNDFVGGAVGAGPMIGAGQMADSGYRRIGNTAGTLGDKAGQVFDLAANSEVAQKGKKWFGDKKGEVVDLFTDDEGKVTSESVKQVFKDAAEGLTGPKLSKEDEAIIRAEVPADLQDKLDSPDFAAWANKSFLERHEKVTNMLADMADAGDEKAGELFDGIANAGDSPAASTAALNAGAQHILESHELEDELGKASAFGKLAGKVAEKGGELASKAGKGLWGVAKEFASGVQKGMSKKNMQGNEDDVRAHLMRNQLEDAYALIADKKRSYERAQLMGEYLSNMLGEHIEKMVPRARARIAYHPSDIQKYLKSIGEEISDLATNWAATPSKAPVDDEVARAQQRVGPNDRKSREQLAGPTSLLPGDKRGQQFDGLLLNLNRITRSLRLMLGKERAPEVIKQLRNMSDPKAAPLFDMIEAELQTQLSAKSKEHRDQIRDEAAQALLATVPTGRELALMSEGINIRAPEGQKTLLDMVEQISTGRASQAARTGLSNLLGANTLNRMLEIVAAHKPAVQREAEQMVDEDPELFDDTYSIDDNGEFVANQLDDFTKNQATKSVERGSGPKMYGFHMSPTYRTSTAGRNPFAGTKKVSHEKMLEWREANNQRMLEDGDLLPDPRGIPRLFKPGQTLHDGSSAIDKKIADMEKTLKVDQTPERALATIREDHERDYRKAKTKEEKDAIKASFERTARKWQDGSATQADLDAFFENRAGSWRVGKKTALEVMEEMNFQPGRMLALFRDHLLMDGKPQQARQVARAVVDMIEMKKGVKQQFRTTPAVRKRIMEAAKKYYGEHEMVVAEQLSDRDPMKITEPEIIEMSRQADKVASLYGPVKAEGTKDDLKNAAKLNEANILHFTSDLSSHQDRVLNIPVGTLVYWVRTQRGVMEAADLEGRKEDRRSANQKYLDDVLEGVAALINSGQVDGWPFKINQFGGRESFAKGIPPSLQLESTTYGGMQYGKAQGEGFSLQHKDKGQYGDAYVFGLANPNMSKEEVLAHMDKIRQQKGVEGYVKALNQAYRKAKLKKPENKAVDFDQNRGEEFFTAEPTEEVDPVVTGMRQKLLTDEEFSEYAKLGTPERQQAFIAKLKRKHGKKWADALDVIGVHGAEFANRAQPSSFMRDRTTKTDPITGEKTPVSIPGQTANRSGAAVADAKTDELGATPLDFFPAQKPGQQPDDFADVLARTKRGGDSVYSMSRSELGIEKPMTAESEAPVRARAIVEALNKTESFADGIAMLKKRIRAAALPKSSAKGVIGGVHYGYPAALALTEESISMMDLGPEEARQVVALREELLKVFAEAKMTPTQRKVVAEFFKTAAPEVAATEAPKAQGGVTVQEHKSSGYRERTAHNANSAGLRELAEQYDLRNTKSALGARKLNAMATRLHTDLGREGFAATHDSPIKHEGRFDWRTHRRKGEGKASFGEGTYLSTSDGVHFAYKKQFTNGRDYALTQAQRDAYEAKIKKYESDPDASELVAEYREALTNDKKLGQGKSPTYEVSVDIKPEQLLNWNAPLSEQSGLVRKAVGGRALDDLSRAIGAFSRNYDDTVYRLEDGTATGAELYEALTERFGSQVAASDYLQSLGILGHKYAADGGRNDTHPNYVIYDDSKITTNYVHFNKQGSDPTGPATPEQIAEAKAYIKKVLGDQVRTEFENITGYSGEYIDAENVIKIATMAAAGPMQTAYHEALHAFFAKFIKNNPQAFEVLKTLAEDAKIVDRLHALLDGYPAAQAQLADGEERLAYIYQFWKAGMLDLPHKKALNLFQKLLKVFKRVLGMVTDSERAVALLEAFDEGRLSDPSVAGKVIAKELAKGTWTKAQLRKLDGMIQWVAGKTLASEVILASSASARARKLAKEFYSNPADGDSAGEEGYLNAKSRHFKQYFNRFKTEIIADLSDRDIADLGQHMIKQTELTDIAYLPVRKAVMQTRQLLQRFRRYMVDERGMDIGDLGPKYFPRVWSKSALIEKEAEFIQMLKNHYMHILQEAVNASGGKTTVDEVAAKIHNILLTAGEIDGKVGPQRDDGVLAPYFQSKKIRNFAWLATEHSAPFQETDTVKTISTYFHDGARSAEYTSRFGQDGSGLDDALTEINNELLEEGEKRMRKGELKDTKARDKWVERQMRDVSDAVAAMEGTIGKDIKPWMRKANGWMVAYQNLRLLPMMLFSSFVDPLGMVARGAPMKEAYDAYLRGMSNVFREWGNVFRDDPKKEKQDKWSMLAEASGIVDSALYNTHVSDEYSSIYMDGKAKKVNDALFKLNGMEAWDRGMRVAATKSAALFIARHKTLPDQAHSERWLKELGITPGDIHLDDNGHLITSKRELMDKLSISEAEAERQADKMYHALSRWVQGAVITPNSAHRPAWGSDPHYSMFFHLKQFTYSFHQTILKRAVKELNYGNLAPLGTFAWYIPVMIASDITKGLIQGGGELPTHMKSMDAAQWMMHGAERAGLLGVGAIGVDASQDLWSVGGPAVEQVMDAFGSPSRNTAINALPLHGLYAQALK